MNKTPLRYPGGKSVMTPFIKELIVINSLKNVLYAEPYAGGAGAAINLLLNNFVDRIAINDASVAIYSFWNILTKDTEAFLKLFDKTSVTLDEWHKQRKIFKSSNTPSLELGFATFFLSRTNRSGILHAGPMGGQDPEKQEKAEYKIDCRFNKETLRQKIMNISEYKNQIDVYNLDAMRFIKQIQKENVFIYLDPPYFCQGKALYLDYYKYQDHKILSDFLTKMKEINWILSYDNVDEIKELYSDFDLYEFNLLYTAQRIKKGSELFTHSKNLKLPNPLVVRRKSSDIPMLKIN